MEIAEGILVIIIAIRLIIFQYQFFDMDSTQYRLMKIIDFYLSAILLACNQRDNSHVQATLVGSPVIINVFQVATPYSFYCCLQGSRLHSAKTGALIAYFFLLAWLRRRCALLELSFIISSQYFLSRN